MGVRDRDDRVEVARGSLKVVDLGPVKPLFVDRYVLYCWCGLALLVGGLVDRLLRGRPWRGAVAVVADVAALFLRLGAPAGTRAPQPQRRHHRHGTARAVREAGRPGDAVGTCRGTTGGGCCRLPAP
ncbi:hypothetical protein [Streptomyces sp. NPDC020607]|uniref:hypothetical protein n=1 Tax=Streptomyces sp. NPDC020607 TaxID=3365082 RepID=UPI0037B8A96F